MILTVLQAICTAVSLLACVPLGELFFFHLILIKKVGPKWFKHILDLIVKCLSLIHLNFPSMTGNHNLWICCGNESHERGTASICWWGCCQPSVFPNQFSDYRAKYRELSWPPVQRGMVHPSQGFCRSSGMLSYLIQRTSFSEK